jgi:hypothetical protein
MADRRRYTVLAGACVVVVVDHRHAATRELLHDPVERASSDVEVVSRRIAAQAVHEPIFGQCGDGEQAALDGLADANARRVAFLADGGVGGTRGSSVA